MPRNKCPEETVEKILDAALKLFLKKGYEETTILDIVNNLGGMTRGAFYHHFKSKEEVFDAIHAKYYKENDPFKKVAGEKKLNGLQKIRMLIRISAVDGFVNKEKIAMDNMSMPLLASPRFLLEQVKGTHEVARHIIPLVKAGQKDGSIPSKRDPKIIAELITLFFNHWMIPTIYPCGEKELNEKITAVKNMLDAFGVPIIDRKLLNELQNSSIYKKFKSRGKK